MKVLELKPPTTPCPFPGRCPWRYFGNKCLHPKAAIGLPCPDAYKVKVR